MSLLTDIKTAAATVPAIADAITARDTQAITDAYNASGIRTKKQPIPINLMVAWAAPSVRSKLQDAANDLASPVRSIALAALDLFGGGVSPTFDSVTYAQLVATLQAAGIATSVEIAALDALATVPDVVSEYDVRRAFWSDDGVWLGV